MIARETDASDVAAKQEGNTTTADEKTLMASSSAAPSSWSRLKDPRIVRVSRAFGGKDRHSKVCTVRGLRDRRVRLSVPTAIQLYDLQDRLGLNQPSKVVDWLLNAAKHEIDELPPLQMPPAGSFIDHSFQPVLGSHVGGEAHQLTKDEGLGIGGSIKWDDHHHHPSEPSSSNTWDSDALLRPKSKELVTRRDSSEDKETFSSNNFFSRIGHSSSPSLGLLNSSLSAYNSLIRWDPSSLSLSQSSQPDQDFNNISVGPLPSGGPHQVLVYQPGCATQSYFPSHIAAAATADYASKQSSFQMLNSSSENPLSNSLAPHTNNDSTGQHVGRPFHLSSTTTKLRPSQSDRESKQDDDSEFHSRTHCFSAI
ncbi:hypothetical protein ACH5RR_014218 [Cinchona calisaya]|uniref:TCP domain-containing protein n=1 Tax=Cinchona calisaya TaxID=153742 RepID=A0ABD3A284_9GENT